MDALIHADCSEILLVRNLILDWFSYGFFIWNFGCMGLMVVHWKGPLRLQQAYLILISALVVSSLGFSGSFFPLVLGLFRLGGGGVLATKSRILAIELFKLSGVHASLKHLSSVRHIGTY